jgi:peptide/nickel transport system substrate-binding protein/oligopeptide transport system substrate-binding protein
MEPPHRTILAFASILLLAVLLSGCGLPWPFSQPTPDPKLPDAQQVFHPLAVGEDQGDLLSLDPAYIFPGSVSYDVAQLLFPPLVTLDDHLHPIDWAAERHEVSADGLTYTFHLRKGMTWSDGTPIDANTFAYSINRALDPCLGAYEYYVVLDFPLDVIKGARQFVQGQCPPDAIHSATSLIGTSLLVPDTLTLQIALEKPAGYFLAALTAPSAWAVPERLVERYTYPTTLPDVRRNGALSTWTQHLTDDGGFGGNLFKLTLWSHPSSARATPVPVSPGTTVYPTVGVAPTFGVDGLAHLVLERNERFWAKKPRVRRIEYTLYHDTKAEWNAFRNGAGDTAMPASSDLDAARTLPGETYQETATPTTISLALNWRIAPFDDLRVRQAFWLAIDRTALVASAADPPAKATTHLLVEGLPDYNPTLHDPAQRTGTQTLSADLVRARALISSYAAEKCSGKLEQCTPISYFVYGYESSPRGREADTLVAQWRAAFPGWPITTGGCDRGCPEVLTPQLLGQTQMTRSGWGVDYPDSHDILSLLWRTGSLYNNMAVSIPQGDSLLDQADASTDRASRTQFYQQAEQLLVDQVAAIPLFQQEAISVARSSVVGWHILTTRQTPLDVWQTTYIRR